MKRFLKIFVPILLSLTIIFGIAWYLLSYDPVFTQDMFLTGARHFAGTEHTAVAAWCYERAYNQKQDFEGISIELAEQYLKAGNYTKAEVTLNRAIRDGAGKDIYIMLSKIYVEQDKLLDAVELIDKMPDSPLKQELTALRPAAPTTQQTPALYNQYIDVTIEGSGNTLYVNPNGEYPSVAEHLYTAPITLTDGENHLYALCVSETGLVSPLSVFTYTVGGIIEDMVFQDSIIEKEIRSLLNVHDSYVISTKDMWTIKSFTVPEHTDSIADLQYMINLETLDMSYGQPGQLSHIQDLTKLHTLTVKNINLNTQDMDAIGKLTSLKKLTLEGCGISSVTQLGSLTELTHLNLSINAVRNISALSSLTQLEELNLYRNVIEDVTPIGVCSFLKKLNISYNTVTDISGLKHLTVLTELDICNNQITDIQVLSSMTELTILVANNNKIEKLDSLASCKKLTQLNISNNVITSLEPLKDHMQITQLDFSYNMVTQLPAWSKSSKFVTINGSYNKISDLSPLSGHEYINNILMDYNENIASVDCLANCHMLIQVNVYGTKVTDVSALTEQDIIVHAPINTDPI